MVWTVLLLIVAALVVLFMAGRWISNLPARDLAQALRVFGATLALLLSSGLMYAGRLGFAAAALGAAYWAFRSFRLAQRPPDPFGPADSASAAPDGATVITRSLRMELDPATGGLDGEVREGPFRGRRLSRLALSELMVLLETCKREDPESEPLVEAFLDRRHPGWRDDGGDAEESVAMTDARAYEILGLRAGASEDEIKAAHRRLMASLHPDRGGSTFLAAQINAAREHLLAKRSGGR